MNTPKSQNPEGKVVAVGYISPEALAALNACRNDEHNGCADIWMRPVNVDDVPLIPATALAAMQRRLEVAEVDAARYGRLRELAWRELEMSAAEFDEEYDAETIKFLRGYGKGDGVTNG